MLFLQATMSPVIVAIGDKLIRVPKMQIDHHIVKGAELAAAHVEEVTAGMDDIRKREYKTFYPTAKPDIPEMRRYVATPEGIRWVITTMLPQAEVFKRNEDNSAGQPLPALSPEEVYHLLAVNGTGRFGGIAREIADLADTSMIDPNPKPRLSQNGGEDPLKSSASPVSTPSPTTGEKT